MGRKSGPKNKQNVKVPDVPVVSKREEVSELSEPSPSKRKKGPKTLHRWQKFYNSKNFGIGIECTRCKKWRKVYEYKEDYEVPEHWECSMYVIDGRRLNCSVPSEHTADDFVEELYVPGSIVWAKCRSFPWWPAMVEDDPDCEEYHVVDEATKKEEYHVVFFYDKPSRDWVKSEMMTFFVNPPPNLKFKGTAALKNRFEKAKYEAKKAVAMDLTDRLKAYSLAVRLQAPKPRNDEEVNEVPATVSKKEQVSEVSKPSTSKRKKETKTSANEKLPIKKQKSSKTSVIPAPSTSHTLIDTERDVRDVQIMPGCLAPTTDTSQAVVPMNTFQQTSPQSPATAENSHPSCSASQPDDLIQACVPEVTVIPSYSGVELTKASGMSPSVETELNFEWSSDDELQMPSPYPVPDDIKGKSIDKLFSDIDSDDCEHEVEGNTTEIGEPTIEATEIEEPTVETTEPPIEPEDYIITEPGGQTVKRGKTDKTPDF